MIEEVKTISTILVVDDSPENLHVLVDALGDQYQVKAVRDGEGALRLVAKTPLPDIILLDILMPGIDGYEVCRRLKQNPATCDIPVIFLTALIEEGHELQGLALGAVDYVRKPISIPLVQARVATHLELAAARRSLIDHVQMLEESARLRDDVENITQHDLKAPLSPILSYPDLLLESLKLNDHQREMIELIRTSGFKLLSMINRSLDLYKMEAGSYPYHAEPQDLLEVIHSSLRELEPIVRRAQLIIDCSTLPVWAKIEDNLAHSLFSNLIKNAIEATPKDGRVTLELEQGEEHAVVRISNPGVVPEEMRDCFFDKYSTAGKDGGTGLGTYSASLMVRTMNGKISMQTDPALGTQVTVLLPLS